MSDLIRRAQEAVSLASNPSLEKRERVIKIRCALLHSEMEDPDEITWMIDDLCEEHGLKQDEDVAELDETDIEHFLDSVTSVANGFIAEEVEGIIDALHAGEEELPSEAIRAVRQHRDLMVPKLIETLQETTANARDGPLPDGNAHFFALFLLTELESKEAFPAIVEAVSLPGELPFELFGDAVTSTLARVFALFDAERQETIDALIRNPELNEYVRWEAAQTYVFLVRDGRLTRDEAVQRLHGHLREGVERDDEEVVQGLVCVMASLAPKEALEEIKEAYARDLVDPFLIRLENVEENIAEGETRIRTDRNFNPPRLTAARRSPCMGPCWEAFG